MRLTKAEAARYGLSVQKPRRLPKPPEPIRGATVSGNGGVTIEIDGWHPVRVNQWRGRHWSVRSKLAKADFEILQAIGLNCARNCLREKRKRCVSLKITLSPSQRRSPDEDAYWKCLLDNLVKLGLLVDDSPKWCEVGSVRFFRGERKQTIIYVIDLPDVGAVENSR